jgi:drug/metabolite transporter (DMT)-like permease
LGDRHLALEPQAGAIDSVAALNALRSVPATTASIFLNLTPVFGVASAYIFLGERLSQSQWVGATAILLSVLALLTWAVAPKAHASTE